MMQRYFIGVVVVLLVGVSLFAQGLSAQDQAAMVAAAQKAALRAVNFHQGDLAGLTRAQADFTPDGWKDFMKSMTGFLDAKGAPMFTSSFVPSKDPVLIDQKNGGVHFRIPGTLKQTQNQSSTTYRAAIEVIAGGRPVKIQHLEPITCLGKSTACQ